MKTRCDEKITTSCDSGYNNASLALRVSYTKHIDIVYDFFRNSEDLQKSFVTLKREYNPYSIIMRGTEVGNLRILAYGENSSR